MNNKIETFFYNAALLQIYGSLLSEQQKEITELYYNYNLSLQEIAESKNITKSAASDAVVKAVKKLNDYEEKLRIYQKRMNLLDELNKLDETNLSVNNQKIIGKIKEEL